MYLEEPLTSPVPTRGDVRSGLGRNRRRNWFSINPTERPTLVKTEQDIGRLGCADE